MKKQPKKIASKTSARKIADLENTIAKLMAAQQPPQPLIVTPQQQPPTSPPLMPTILQSEPPAILLDLGCGLNPYKDPNRGGVQFEGVDKLDFGQKHRVDLRVAPWPWEDSSVDQVWSAHFVEHLTSQERVVFFNELYRILKPGPVGTPQRLGAIITTPYWSSMRAYGDPTHRWPPISEFNYLYLDRSWRLGDKEKNIPANAPHVDEKYAEPGWGFSCDFACNFGYVTDQQVMGGKYPEVQAQMLRHYVNSVNDLQAMLEKRPR